MVLDLLDDLLGADEVGQLGDDDPLAARGDRLDPGRRPGAERTAAGEVGVADAVEADDPAAARQVGAGHELHEVVERAGGVGDEVPGGADDLDEVVRGHVGGHPDGDAAGAVDEQVGERGGHDLRLGLRVVVVGDEVDRVLVEPGHHEQGGRCHPRLGVARGGRTVVEGAEVAVSVDEGQPHGERLGHPHEGVVDGLVAVRVVLAHDLADDALALDVRPVGAQAELAHAVEDPALHRLEAVPGVGQGPGVDDGVGVLEEGVAHLLLDVDVDDPLGRLVGRLAGRGSTRAAAGHTGSGSFVGGARPSWLTPGPDPSSTHRRPRRTAVRVWGARRLGSQVVSRTQLSLRGAPRPSCSSGRSSRRSARPRRRRDRSDP